MVTANNEATLLEFSMHPPDGWIRSKRNKLAITGPQLAAKMGVSKQRISALEKAERSGAASLKTMKQAAEALGCEFVYALVPKGSMEAPGIPDTPSILDPLACIQSQHCNEQVAAICKHFAISHLGLYGSAARGELKDDSDINLLAEFSSSKNAAASDIEEIELQFSRLFGRKTTIANEKAFDDPKQSDVIMADLKIIYAS